MTTIRKTALAGAAGGRQRGLRGRVRVARLARRAALGLALLAAGCASGPPVQDDIAADAVREVELPDGRRQLALLLEHDEVVHRAVLEETEASRGRERTVFRVLAAEPPGAGLGWIYPLVPPTADLEVGGRVQAHPDHQPTADLLRLLEAKPPAVLAAIAGLERLHRLEGRGKVLARAAELVLHQDQLDRVIEVAAAGDKGPLLGPGPGGRPAGGSRAETLGRVLGVLGSRTDLDAPRADRIARLAPQIGRDPLEVEIVLGLARRGAASVGAVTEACQALDEPQTRSAFRRDVLGALARREHLGAVEADVVVRAVPGIGNDGYEAEILLALVRRGAQVPYVLDATVALDGSPEAPELRRRVIMALALREDLGRAAADRVAAAVPRIGSDPAEAGVLLVLAERMRASTGAIVEAARELSEPGPPSLKDRRRVLLKLVDMRGREAEDADVVARGAPLAADDAVEAEVLLALIEAKQASAAAVIEAVEEIDASSAAPQLRADVLAALVGLRGSEREDANRLAAAVPMIRDDGLEAEVLAALLARRQVSTEAFLAAMAKLDGSSSAPIQRRSLLLALVAQRGSERLDADRAAEAVPAIGEDSYEAEVLIALIGKGQVSTDEVLDAVGDIDVSSSQVRYRRDVLTALARGRLGRLEDARAIAGAVPDLADDRAESEVLKVLAEADSAPIEAILSAVDEIDPRRSASRYRSDVLMLLARRGRLERADADALAEAIPGIEDDALEAGVLAVLGSRGVASAEAVREAAEAIQSASAREQVEPFLGGSK